MRRLLVGLSLVLIAAACGGSSETEPAVASPEAPPTSLELESPLETALGIASEPGRRQHQLLEMQQVADAQLVDCMRNSGFFYEVAPVQESLGAAAFVGDGTPEWTAQNGLGITGAYVDAVETSGAAARPDTATTNLNYVASLTPAEAEAYDVALIGKRPADAELDASYQPAGCWGAAFSKIVERLGFIEEFSAELDAMNARLASDPRVVAFSVTWSECMASRDYRYADQTAMADDVYARLLELKIVEVDGATTFADPQAVADLKQFEQTAALASLECSESFRSEHAQLRHDYEEEFLDDNRFRIAEMAQGSP